MESVTQPPKHPWEKLGYEPVLGITDRIVSRYLRAQRKNMRRFFTERGLHDLTDRLEQIRKSRQGMLAKNQMFQKVLDEYAKRIAPPGAAQVPSPEAASGEVERSVVVPSEDVGAIVSIPVPDGGAGRDAGASVPEVASPGGNEPVIEE